MTNLQNYDEDQIIYCQKEMQMNKKIEALVKNETQLNEKIKSHEENVQGLNQELGSVKSIEAQLMERTQNFEQNQKLSIEKE